MIQHQQSGPSGHDLINREFSRYVRTSANPDTDAAIETSDLDEASITEIRQVLGLVFDLTRQVDLAMTHEEAEKWQDFKGLTDPNAAAFASGMPDRSFRGLDPNFQRDLVRQVIRDVGGARNLQGILSSTDQFKLWLSASKAAGLMSPFVMNQVQLEVIKRVGGFISIFPDGTQPSAIISALEARSEEIGIGYSVNLANESARTVEEAKANREWYKAAIKSGAQRLAIKPTSLVAQSTAAISYKAAKKELTDALKDIFSFAETVHRADGRKCIVMVDSEADDLMDRMLQPAIHAAALDQPKAKTGEVIQAYAKNAPIRLNRAIEMSEAKLGSGPEAEPQWIRLVCGANRLGEYQKSSANGWILDDGGLWVPTLNGRPAVQGQFLKLADEILERVKNKKLAVTFGSMDRIKRVHVLMKMLKAGVFLSEHSDRASLAMLTSMGETEEGRILCKTFKLDRERLIAYTPVTLLKTLVKALKYYLRRMDEFTGVDPEHGTRNAMGAAAEDGIGSPKWIAEQVKCGYLVAMAHVNAPDAQVDPHDGQKPWRGEHEPLILPNSIDEYRPTPAANFASPDYEWMETNALTPCRERTPEDAHKIGPSWDAPDGVTRSDQMELKGPCREDLVLAHVQYPAANQIDEAGNFYNPDIDAAYSKAHSSTWPDSQLQKRWEIMRNAVRTMKNSRAKLLQSLALNIDKSMTEAEGEVNEGMDFINIIRLYSELLGLRDNLNIGPKGNGVALKICPKNFPQAIPIAHIIALLLSGHKVIVKPSGGENEEAIWATHEAIKCLWDAGVPQDALIFMPCDNNQAAYAASKADHIGFTGGTDTARKIKKANPETDMVAETGGRNVIIVDSSYHMEDAAWLVAKSIIGFAGQKCSKPAAIIFTGDVDYDEFKAHLVNIFKAFLVGNSLIPNVDVTGLSKELQPGSDLHKKCTEMLPGVSELWRHNDKKYFGLNEVTDFKAFDFSSIEEIFAPLATLVKIDGDVHQAISMVNNLPGNLTGAILTNSNDAIQYAIKNWQTGNLYINDTCTGAPAHLGFGSGTGDTNSCGPHGVKTGTIEWNLMNAHVTRVNGKNAKYDKSQIKELKETNAKGLQKLLLAMEENAMKTPQDGASLPKGFNDIIHAGWSCLYENERHFSKKRPCIYQTEGVYDWIESRKVGLNILRIMPNDQMFDIAAKIFAALAAGNDLVISVNSTTWKDFRSFEKAYGIDFEKIPGLTIRVNSDSQFQSLISQNGQYPNQHFSHVTYTGKDKVPKEVFETAAAQDLYIDHRPATGDGLNDMITQFRQQSFSWVYHSGGDTSEEGVRRNVNPGRAPYEKSDLQDRERAAYLAAQAKAA